MWISYILTGAGANLISWLVLPRSAVSVGASGAVFGLFAISVLVKVKILAYSRYKIACVVSISNYNNVLKWLLQISWDWRKIIEVLVLGQFVIDKVNITVSGNLDISLLSRNKINQMLQYTVNDG